VKPYGAAESAADLATYYRLKWLVAGRSLLLILLAAALLVPFSRWGAAALAIGGACGVGNMLAIMRGSERLVQTGSRLFFGLSSLLRLSAFSIVAAALAVRGPWWSLGPFLAGFFFPLATYALGALRAFRRKP
jgi:hypothetical protein